MKPSIVIAAICFAAAIPATADTTVPPTASFGTASITTLQSSGEARIPVNVNGPPLSDSLGTTVRFTSVEGTATWVNEYDTLNSSLKFYTGETSKTLIIGIVSAPAFGGAKSFTVRLNNDSDYNIGVPSTVTINIIGSLAPEISVEEPVGTDLVDGSGDIGFGGVLIGTTSPTKTFTIRNNGSAALTGLAITTNGTHASRFTVKPPTVSSIPQGSAKTFTVSFSPVAAEVCTASIHIASNDSDESPFDIAISGTGTVSPEIAVEQPMGTSTTSGIASRSFGTVLVGSAGAPMNFTIRNVGSDSLSGIVVAMEGDNPSDFAATVPTTSTLSPGANTTFTVTFAPGAAESRMATLLVSSNDSDEGSFAIQLIGAGAIPAPEIAIEQPVGVNLVDGSAQINFGTVNRGMASGELAFVVKNNGTADLTSFLVVKDGAGSGDFVVSGPDKPVIAPNDVAAFSVTFMPKSEGNKAAALHIFSNDGNEDPFDIKLTGTAIVPAPEIVVNQPLGSNLKDGTSKKSFGTVSVGKAGASKVFTIKNTGSLSLAKISTAKSGANAADFVVTPPSKTTLAPSGSTTFKVTFRPRAKGTRKAFIQIKSNDSDENPFDISVAGEGAAK